MGSENRVLELEERIRLLETQNLELRRHSRDSHSVSPSSGDVTSSERADPFELDLLDLDEIEERDEDEW